MTRSIAKRSKSQGVGPVAWKKEREPQRLSSCLHLRASSVLLLSRSLVLSMAKREYLCVFVCVCVKCVYCACMCIVHVCVCFVFCGCGLYMLVLLPSSRLGKGASRQGTRNATYLGPFAAPCQLVRPDRVLNGKAEGRGKDTERASAVFREGKRMPKRRKRKKVTHTLRLPTALFFSFSF